MIRTPNKPSRKVLEFETIARDARLMSKLIQNYVDPNGKGPNQHFALHHSQFSGNPYNFFVVNPTLFGASSSEVVVVVNPKILERDYSTKKLVSEACMSFPFRPAKKVHRYGKLKVRYQVPTEDGKGLKTKEEEMSGFMAQIFQHEVEHAQGSHIYATK